MLLLFPAAPSLAQQNAAGFLVFVAINASDIVEVGQEYRAGALGRQLDEEGLPDVGVSRGRLLRGEILSSRATNAAKLVCLSRRGNAAPSEEDVVGSAAPGFHSAVRVRDVTRVVFLCVP